LPDLCGLLAHPVSNLSRLPSSFVVSLAIVAACGGRASIATSDASGNSDSGNARDASSVSMCGLRYGTGWGTALPAPPGGQMAITTDGQGHIAGGTFDSSSGTGQIETRDANGAILWSNSIGAVALAPAGDGGFYAVATGHRTGLPSVALVTRLNASGVAVWSQTLSGSVSWRGAFVATDPTGDVWVLGSTAQAPSTVNTPVVQGAFIARLDADGHVILQQTLYGAGMVPRGLALDGEGRALVALSLGYGLLSIGDAEYDGNDGAVVAAFNSDGSPSWSRSVSESMIDQLTGLARDNDGTVYATGLTPHSRSDAAIDGFVTALTPTGGILWRHVYDGAYWLYIAARACGGLFVSMQTSAMPGLADAEPEPALVVLDLDATGNELRRHRIPGACATVGGCNLVPGNIVAHGSDGLIITGSFSGTGTFDAIALTPAPESEERFMVRVAD
jgi:hypothetical protein